MALKQLKFNMIFGGNHYSFGTILEESDIPLNLRKAKYLIEPEEKVFEQDEEEFIDTDDIILGDEELPPTRIPTDARAKYFKPKKK